MSFPSFSEIREFTVTKSLNVRVSGSFDNESVFRPSNKTLEEWVMDGIQELMNNPSVDHTYICSGDGFVYVSRDEDDDGKDAFLFKVCRLQASGYAS